MGMMDQVCSYRVMMAAGCWVLAVGLGMTAWLGHWPDLRFVGIAFVAVACTLTIINDNARTRRLVRLSLTEPAERVRSLR